MNPTPQAVAAIRGQVADWTQADAAIAAALNQPDRPNPNPAAAVPVAFTGVDAMALVSADSLSKLKTVPSIVVAFRNDLDQDNTSGAFGWLRFAVATGLMSAGELAAILAAAGQQRPDPAWPPLISWAQATLGRPVTTTDIHQSRPETHS